ncbi:unnamed protein product [Cunninghamella echinulata]
MAIENGSFDGGDQGLLNKYFSSWSASSSDHRLPFTYNMTPTSQYTYAPAHQYYSNNISICHFIGLNKPWKYQRYSDGSVFSHQWKGYTDLLQSWWNTWNLHYGQTEPDHLLSRSPNDIIIYSYKHQPIPLFNHFTENVWDNINIHNYMEDHHHHRHIIPMPPVDKITITHSGWVDNRSSHHYDETSQCSSHHIDEDRSEYFGPEKHDSITATTTTDLGQSDYNQNNKEKYVDSHTNYQMITWDPACESPPNQGMSANIPDLSEYGNAWDKPLNYNSVWIAPDPQPIPKFDFDYEFVHERQENHQHDQHYRHEQQYQHEHQYEQHQHELNEQHHEYNHQEHHEEIKPKEIHQPIFPWEYRQEPVSIPTRIWLDELVKTAQHELEVVTVDESIINENSNYRQDQHIQNSNNDSHGNQHDATSQAYNVKEGSGLDDREFELVNQTTIEKIDDNQNKIISDEYTLNTQSNNVMISDGNYDDNNGLQIDKDASDSIAYAMDAISYKSIVRNLERSQKSNKDDVIKNNQKNESYPITNNDGDGDGDDDDDRQLIPIPFKATSKLNPGGISPTPVQSPISSRRSSISRSRRSSLSSQKSNSNNILSPTATKLPIIYTDNIINSNYSQPSQAKPTLVQTNLSFSKMTPYTSAATTPTKEYASFIYDIDGLATLNINTETNKKIIASNEIHTDIEKSETALDHRTSNHLIIGEGLNEKNTKQDEVKEYITCVEEEECDDYYNQYSIDESLQNTYNPRLENNNKWNPELALELLRAQSNHIISNHEYKSTLDELITVENSNHQEDTFISLMNSAKATSHMDNNNTLNVGNNNGDNLEATSQKQYSWDSIMIPSSKQDTISLDCKDYVSYKNVSEEIQSAGTTSPTTPIVRSLKNNLTFEIEAAKEQHRQQRAALALVQPKTAIATVLEAELDLTKSGLFNRRSHNHVFIDGINNSNNSSSNGNFNNFKTITKDAYTISEFDLTPDRDTIHEKINTGSLQYNENNDLNISYFSFNNIKNTFESTATTSTQTTGFNVRTWRDDVNNSFKQERSVIRKDRIEEDNNNNDIAVDDDDDEEVEEEYAAFFDSSIINAAKNKMKELVTECTASASSYDLPLSSTNNTQNNPDVTEGESSLSNMNTSLQNLSRYTFTESLYGLPSQPFHPYITMKNLKSGPPSPSNVSTLSLGSIASNNQSKAVTHESDHSISSDDSDEDHVQTSSSLFFSGINDYHQHQTNNITIQSEVDSTVENEQPPSQPSSSFFFADDNDNHNCVNDQTSQIIIQNVTDQTTKNEQIPSQLSSICSESPENQSDLNKIIQLSSEGLSLEPSSISNIKENDIKDKTIFQESYETTNTITATDNPSPTTASAQSLSIIEKSSHGDLYSDEQNISTWLSLTATSDESDNKIKNNDNDNNRDTITHGIQDDEDEEKDDNHTHIFDGTIIKDINPKEKKSKLLALAQSSPLLVPTTGVSMRKDLQKVIQSDHEVRSSSSLTPSTSVSSISSLPPAPSVTDDGETVYLSALEDISDITSVEWRSAASATPIIDDPNDDDDLDNDGLFINESGNNSDDNNSFNLDHHLVTIENNMVNTSTSTNKITTITTTTTVTNEATIIKTTTTTAAAATDASSDENSSLESDHTII